MDKNFKVGQSNELVQGDKIFDLHNCYDFSGFFLRNDYTAFLAFGPNAEYGIGLPPVLLEFCRLDYLMLSSDFFTLDRIDLDEIGYKSPNDIDDQWLLGEDQADSECHIFFRFLGGHFVRMHGSRAELREASIQLDMTASP